MPTGYTAAVQDGRVTEFSDFAMQCARNFGALIMMRDHPANAEIPERFEPSDYHSKEGDKARTELARLRGLTVEEIGSECRAEFEEAERYRAEYIERRATTRARYEAMLAKVREWTPPSPDHVGMKSFMVRQLTESIEFDCGGNYLPAVPTLDPDRWYAEKVQSLTQSIDRHDREHREEVERTEGRNRWLAQLRASLAEPTEEEG